LAATHPSFDTFLTDRLGHLAHSKRGESLCSAVISEVWSGHEEKSADFGWIGRGAGLGRV